MYFPVLASVRVCICGRQRLRQHFDSNDIQLSQLRAQRTLPSANALGCVLAQFREPPNSQSSNDHCACVCTD